MPRKKISTAEVDVPIIADLDDDEDFIETTTTTRQVGRKKREAAAAAVLPPADDADDETIIDVDDDGEPIEGSQFPPNTLAALLYNESEVDDIANEFCTIIPRRLPDNIDSQFLKPCREQMSLQSIANVPLSTDQEEIEDRVRNAHGSGGRFLFQVRFANRMQRSWQNVLADPPSAERSAETAVPAAAVPASAAAATPAVDPVTQFLDGLEKQARLKDLLFGDREREFQQQIAELKSEVAASRAADAAEPKSERLLLLEQALSTGNEGLQKRMLDHLFPSEDPDKRSAVAEIADLAIQNYDKLPAIFGAVGSLINGLLFGNANAAGPAGVPPAAAASPGDISHILRQPPPAASPPIAFPAGGFQRRDLSEPPASAGGQFAETVSAEPPPVPLVPDAPAVNAAQLDEIRELRGVIDMEPDDVEALCVELHLPPVMECSEVDANVLLAELRDRAAIVTNSPNDEDAESPKQKAAEVLNERRTAA